MTEITQQTLENALVDFPFDQIAYLPVTGSTNDLAAEWANEWATKKYEGFGLILADEQTAGRGRSGRTWFTPPGAALAFTVLLPPVFDMDLAGRLAGMAAVAICQALEKGYGLAPQIKWPNDVLLDGAKCAGILPESHWRGDQLAAQFIGVGINVAPQSVPPEEGLTFSATCVEHALGEPVERLELLQAVMAGLFGWYERLGSPGLLSAWEKRLAFKGEPVVLLSPDGAEQQRGALLGLAENGSLRLESADGSETEVQNGELRLRAG